MELHLVIGALLRPLFWLVVLGGALWLVRQAFPDSEDDLFNKGPIDGLKGIIQAARKQGQDRQAPPSGQ